MSGDPYNPHLFHWNCDELPPYLMTDITLRDLFAGMAMQGMVASPNFVPEEVATAVRCAYGVADAMLEERSK